MKNLLLLLLIIATIRASGQNHFLGVKGGASWTDVTARYFPVAKHSRAGFAYGLTYDYLFKKHFSTGADIIYNQRGFTTDFQPLDAYGNPVGGIVQVQFNYDYLTVPLKLAFNYGKTLYGFANIALTPSLLVEAKTILPDIHDNGTVIRGQAVTVTDMVNKFDIGGLIEIGGGFKFKERCWVFTSFSGERSFTTITNSNYFADTNIKHYAMTFNLGLKCALTKG